MAERIDRDNLALVQWRAEKNRGALNTLIELYKSSVFPFVIYLGDADLNTAYEITVKSFVEALVSPELSSAKNFSVVIYQQAIDLCRAVPPATSFDPLPLIKKPQQRKDLLRVARKAVSGLTFDQRAAVLLRDQVHLSYDEIAGALKIGPSEAKSKVLKARAAYREKIEHSL